jgi:hypothetical protein
MMVGKGIEDIDITMPRDAYDTGKDIPTFNAYLTVVVRDSEGRVVKVHRQRSHSPTANFIGLMLPLNYFSNTGGSFTITNTGNGTFSYRPQLNGGAYGISYPNSNTSNPGFSYITMIQVGSGTQSNPYSAYSLASPIANGSGTGQLVYGQPSIPSNITVSGSSAYFTISQTFNNQSGGTISITEVGIITTISFAIAVGTARPSANQLLVWYDVLSSPISVSNGGSVTIYYTFTINP